MHLPYRGFFEGEGIHRGRPKGKQKINEQGTGSLHNCGRIAESVEATIINECFERKVISFDTTSNYGTTPMKPWSVKIWVSWGQWVSGTMEGSNVENKKRRVDEDSGMLMDLVSPLFPSAFIFIVCLGSISRSFTGVASGATRAALTQHFSLQNNAADISAKEGSQETLATMTGMVLGMLLAHITMGHLLSIWVSILSLTVFHMYVLPFLSISLGTSKHLSEVSDFRDLLVRTIRRLQTIEPFVAFPSQH